MRLVGGTLWVGRAEERGRKLPSPSAHHPPQHPITLKLPLRLPNRYKSSQPLISLPQPLLLSFGAAEQGKPHRSGILHTGL